MADRHIPDLSPRLSEGSIQQERRSRERRQSPERAASDTTRRPSLNNEQCGECLAALAHRLSQPLTALWGSLELALRTELSAQESRAALEQAFELTDLAVNTIKSMRELADAARTDAPTKLLSLGDLVRATLGDWQELADARGIKTRFMASLEVMVAAPPDRLRELVSRLLCLVIRRSPENGKSWLCLSARGGAADLLIADHGPSPRPGEFGLPSPETPSLAHLFAEAAKNRSLEWAVVKVLAESLGGSLQVAPRQPQGCCFLLRLPLAKEKEQRP